MESEEQKIGTREWVQAALLLLATLAITVKIMLFCITEYRVCSGLVADKTQLEQQDEQNNKSFTATEETKAKANTRYTSELDQVKKAERLKANIERDIADIQERIARARADGTATEAKLAALKQERKDKHIELAKLNLDRIAQRAEWKERKESGQIEDWEPEALDSTYSRIRQLQDRIALKGDDLR